MNWPLLRVNVASWQYCRRSCSKVGGWEREQLGKTVPQPKGNFLMELTDLPFHGSGGAHWRKLSTTFGMSITLCFPIGLKTDHR
jgi:hypothetical protein